MYGDDNLTPPPRRGTISVVQPMPQPPAADEIHPARTRFTLELKAMTMMAGAIFVAGVGAGVQLNALVSRVGQIEQRMAQVSTRYDLDEVKREVRRMRTRLKRVVITCPASVARGAKDVQCEAVIALDDDQ